MLTGLIDFYSLDRSIFPQLGDDIVALGIRIRSGGVGDLKCEPREGQAGISCAGTDPKNALIVRRPVGVLPEPSGSPCVPSAGHAQSPKPDVMALPRAIIDCLLEADVLAAPEKVEGAERGGRVWRVEYKGSDHAPRACQPQSICF